jgi:phage tail-like protein
MRFVVRVEAAPGVPLRGQFVRMSELSAEVAVSSLHHGGSAIPVKAPARVNFPDVTLERGATQDALLESWFAQTVAPTPSIGGTGLAYQRDLDIVEQDRDGSTLNRWRLFRAFPSKYMPADGYDNESDDFIIESVTLAYSFFIPVGLPGAVDISHIQSSLG